MRALLISLDPNVITEVDLPENQTARVLKMNELLGSRLFTGAGTPNLTHACWADDEALLTLEATVLEKGAIPLTQVSWYPEPLVGNLLVTGIDPLTGTTIPATLTIAELASMIKPGRLIMGSEDPT